jgi:hypothetical protein
VIITYLRVTYYLLSGAGKRFADNQEIPGILWNPLNHLYVPIVLKSGSLKLLEPSAPVQACNGIAYRYQFCLLLGSRLLQGRTTGLIHAISHSDHTVTCSDEERRGI